MSGMVCRHIGTSFGAAGAPAAGMGLLIVNPPWTASPLWGASPQNPQCSLGRRGAGLREGGDSAPHEHVPALAGNRSCSEQQPGAGKGLGKLLVLILFFFFK